jgi:hypothetical protein
LTVSAQRQGRFLGWTTLRLEGTWRTFDEIEGTAAVLANGSEVSTLYEASLIIAEEGIRARVVSAISEGLFNDQDDDYRNMVLPAHIPVFGLTAGLPSTLSGFMKGRHKIKGMTAFGYSAPAAVLDEKFGFKRKGEPFYEAGIKHFLMEYRPDNNLDKALEKAVCRR